MTGLVTSPLTSETDVSEVSNSNIAARRLNDALTANYPHMHFTVWLWVSWYAASQPVVYWPFPLNDEIGRNPYLGFLGVYGEYAFTFLPGGMCMETGD